MAQPLIGRVDCIELDMTKFPFKVHMKEGEIVLKTFEFKDLEQAKKACNEMNYEIVIYKLEQKNGNKCSGL